MRAFVDYARAVPRAAAQMRANLRTPMPRTHAELGEMTFGGLAGYLESDVPRGVRGRRRTRRSRRSSRTPTPPPPRRFRELGAWFHEQIPPPGTDAGEFRLGAELFARMLRETERVDLPLAELEAAGRRELERNLAALREALRRLRAGPSDGRLPRPGAAPASPPDGPVEAARRQLAGLRRFVEEQGLVSIPGEEEARIEEAPPYQRWNSAYIDIPGPYDRHLPSIYYIAPPDPTWTHGGAGGVHPERADLLFVTAHEVWPGHFLQFLHSNRAESELGPALCELWFREGWAHYTEEMMWEAGFGDGDPEPHIGQLQNALLRNVRSSAIGLHTGTMTVAEAERMFREQGSRTPRAPASRRRAGPSIPATSTTPWAS